MKNDVLYMGVKKLLVLGGWQVGWGWGGGNQLWDHHHCVWVKLVAGPSPLQRAQKIVKNDVSFMGV